MRRAVLWAGFGLALGFGLSGIGTAAAEDVAPEVIHPPMPVPKLPIPEEFRGAPAPRPALEAAPLLGEPAPLAPALTGGFEGLGDNICSEAAGSCTIPPDTHGAVGLDDGGQVRLMEVLNTEVHIQDDTGFVVWGPVTLDAFWGAAVNPNLDGAFDPRVHWDPHDNRWISVVCDEARSAASAVMVGVSQTADPAGAWYKTSIDADGSNAVWADYPNVGFNYKWVVVQVNLFTMGGSFDSTQIWVFDKADLYSGNFTPAGDFRVSGHSGTQVPAVTYDAAEENLYLLQTANGNYLGLGYLRLYRISGPADAPVLDWLDPVQQWVVSPDPWELAESDASPFSDFAPQTQDPAPSNCGFCPAPPCRIYTNDDRIQNLVLRNGTLWATHTIFLPPGVQTRSSVQWWQIAPDTTVLQRGRVDDPTGNRFLAFPSIAVNKHEDVLLGYSSFEGLQYASGSYSFRSAFDPPDTMQSESLLRDGDACYFKDLNIVPSRNRWGDYSATVVAPDDTKLWTLQEYAAFPDLAESIQLFRDKWGTYWGLLDTTRTISIADASIAEGNAGPTSLDFTLTLSAPTTQTVTVDWSTADGTATLADNDYDQVVNAPVTFNPGVTTQTITVTVNGDLKYEGDETLSIILTNATNAVIAAAPPQATGTILNDDLPPRMSVGDVQALEGNAGTTDFVFPVTLSAPSGLPASASWSTVDGTATVADSDYNVPAPAPVSFPVGSTLQNVTVTVNGDTNVEPDEVFYVELTGPVGATLLRTRGAGVIFDDDATNPPVEALTAVAGPTGGQLLLQWLNPAVSADEVVIRYFDGPGCAYPVNPSDGNGISVAPVAGAPQSTPHNGLIDDREYCYTTFLRYGAAYSAGVNLTAVPFAAGAGKLRWKYFTGATVLAAPTVNVPSVMGLSNDHYVHAMQRGSSGGPWPGPPWRPWNLGAAAQQRSPVAPLPSGPRAYIATQDGKVHAINADTGVPLWSTQLLQTDNVTPALGGGAPAGIFTAWGGAWDYILAGTNEANNNRLYALDPFTGAVVDIFDDGGGIGAIQGMPSVDYAAQRVYFASLKGSNNASLWCLDLGPPGPGALSLRWRTIIPNGINNSPVLHNDRVYAVDISSNAWSVSVAEHATIPNTPAELHSFSLGDSNPKGFLFPDRRNDDVYIATENKIHGLVDTGGAVWSRKWERALNSTAHPSIVLYVPGTNTLYVGVDQYPNLNDPSYVLEVETVNGNVVQQVMLETTSQAVGAPTLDINNNLLLVGSEPGIIYAVQVPF